MNTPAHAVVNLLILGQKKRPEEVVPILIGAILPDLPMVFFYFYEKVILKMPEQKIWSDLYFDPDWQIFFDFFNALPILLLALLLATRSAGRKWLVPFFSSMIFHVFFDLPLHNDDAHGHFFPLSDWHFHSPVSYWDPAHYGQIVAPIEVLLVLIGSFVLFRRYPSLWVKSLVGAVGAVYLSYWGYIFLVWA
ncbi:MAG: hypothetical protein ACE5FY_06210 [Nitrospiria bacterium]